MAATECPRCRYPRSYTTDIPYPKACQEGISILVLQAEVRHLEDVIARLNEDRAILLRRINDAQDLTRNLPPEVLTHIFQFVRPPIDFSTHQDASYRRHAPDSEGDTFNAEEDYHYTLIAVSRRWREIALSIPHLWTSIALGATDGSMQSKISLLDFHFFHVKNFPISVELDFRDLEMSPRQDPADRTKCLALIDPLMTAIFIERPSNIQHLLLIHPPMEWLPLINANFSRCDSVTISYPSFGQGWVEQFPNFKVDFTQLPSLRNVHLMDCGALISLPQSMTSCRLLSSHVNVCLDILLTHPNLVTFESMEPDASPIPWSFHFMGAVTVPNLEELTWSCHAADSNELFVLFMQFIRFSKLRTLQWCDDKHDFPFRSHRFDFFSSLPNTLTSITFNVCRFDDNCDLIEQLLYCVPQLTELHFLECDPVTVGFAIWAIGRPLSQPPAGSEGSDMVGNRPSGLNVLPNLRVLSIEDSETLDVYDAWDFVEMFKVLRANRMNERFYLTFTPDIDWDPESLAEIQALLSSGFNAKIDFGCRILE